MAYHDHKTQGLICLAILQGRAEESFLRHNVAQEQQHAYRSLAAEIATAAIRRRSPTRAYFQAPIRNPLNIAVGIAALVGACSFAIAFALGGFVDLSARETLLILGGVAGFAAIGVAAIGWGVSGCSVETNHGCGRRPLRASGFRRRNVRLQQGTEAPPD